jgi:replicative DNA helicase
MSQVKTVDVWERRREDLARAAEIMKELVHAAERRNEAAFISAWNALKWSAEERGEAVAVPSSPQSMPQVVDTVTKDIERAFQSHGAVEGLQTGLRDLDLLLPDVLARGHSVVLASRPSMGTTALATQIACHVALRQKRPVLYFTRHLRAKEIAAWMIAGESKIEAALLRRGFIERHQWSALAESCVGLSESAITIDDTCTCVAALIDQVRAVGSRKVGGSRSGNSEQSARVKRGNSDAPGARKRPGRGRDA